VGASRIAWAVALVVVLLYLFLTEFMLYGGVNLGLLTEGALARIGLRGWASAGVTLLIASVAASILAILLSRAFDRR
jgi:ABC-type Fe3+ transport system permease subunit